MSEGYVYVLTNPAMPGLVKVGKTSRDPDERAKQLSGGTGVPVPFEVYGYEFCPNYHEAEVYAHKALDFCRCSKGREFFACDPKRALQEVSNALHEQVSIFMSEHVPDQVLVHELCHVDEVSIMMLADQLGVRTYEVAAAMGELTAEELKPALERAQIIFAKRVEARRAAKLAAESEGDE